MCHEGSNKKKLLVALPRGGGGASRGGLPQMQTGKRNTAVRRKWIKFVQFKHANFAGASPYAHLCIEHFAACDFANFNGIQHGVCFRSKWNLKLTVTAIPSKHKAPKQIEKHGTPL